MLFVPVNYATRTRSFQHADIIMPCVGEGVRRVRKHERPVLPVHALRLLRMYSCAASLHCHSEQRLLFDGAELACVLCSGSAGDVFTCAFCMQSVHESCCNKLTRDCADVLRRSSFFLLAEHDTSNDPQHLACSKWSWRECIIFFRCT